MLPGKRVEHRKQHLSQFQRAKSRKRGYCGRRPQQIAQSLWFGYLQRSNLFQRDPGVTAGNKHFEGSTNSLIRIAELRKRLAIPCPNETSVDLGMRIGMVQKHFLSGPFRMDG